jgi:proline iminopeptidase
MAEKYLAVRGTRLFVDLRGDEANPPLLYLHGGPGTSCYGFMLWQGDLLARSLFVVGMDQRGVLRSDPLTGDLTEEMLVDDCEGVREALGIERWTVLGHSYGGRIALRYATRYPERVSAVIFENPAWDFDDTERLRLPAAAVIFDELGDGESAARCRALATRPERINSWQESFALYGKLVDRGRYDDLFLHQPANRARYAEGDTESFPAELRERTAAHSQQALDRGWENLLGLLPMLSGPATVIKGRYDLVMGPRQLEAFAGPVNIFENSGHFVQLEEPEAYAELVRELVR